MLLFASCESQPVKSKATGAAVYGTKSPHPDGTGKVYLGREIAHVMSASGAAWLERDTRQEEENVALALSKLELQPNSVVADIGAGTGYYTFRLALKVPQGTVYAVEVQDKFVSSLKTRKKELGFTNVTVVKGSAQAPNLPEASVDLAIMVDVYHELEFPREMLQALQRALKPTGKLLLLEYRAEDPSVPIKELHKMSVAQANKELQANGFSLYRRENFLPIQHFLLYEKAKK
ncbi:methyltransferase type 11 [Rufibacter tibetensis]|uniref:Methyltransferase type 11 n=1 Tax=Rufibacter tibetensis TaxID=512763 RepID=A0A0P0D3T1_9BACT|nr:methyltransferase type 11 [Rufibacter tibetensis]